MRKILIIIGAIVAIGGAGFADMNLLESGKVTNNDDEIVKNDGEVVQCKIIELKQGEFMRVNVGDKKFQYKWKDIESFKVGALLFKTENDKNKTIASGLYDRTIAGGDRYQRNNRLPKYDDKSPFLAGVLSFVIPGLGQLYNGNGEELKGILMFLSAATCSYFYIFSSQYTLTPYTYNDYGYSYTDYYYTYNPPSTLWLIGLIGVDIFSVIDAVGGANYFNDHFAFNVLPQEQKLCLVYKIKF